MKIIVYSLLLLIFTSCQGKKSEVLTSESTDHELKLRVWGEQTFMFEPWTVYIATDYQTEKDTVFTELHANDVDSASVSFEWQDHRYCIVNLKHQDGELSQVPIRYRK